MPTLDRQASFDAAAGPTSYLPISVFVHLAHGFDARRWRQRWEKGELVGVNDPTPYGYGWAEQRVKQLGFSEDRPENAIGRLMRLGLRFVLGFDLLHAYNNRKAILASDVVWTHTESQFLAIALLLKRRRGPRPRMIGQSVWLFDGWSRFSRLRQRFYSWLIRDVDVLTVHSPANLAVAQRLFPDRHAELVLFGIPAETLRPPRIRSRGDDAFRILAVGNDRHRDWVTVIEAVRQLPDVHLTLVSSTASPSLVAGVENAEIRVERSNEGLNALFEGADLIVVPLKSNLHASGITVLQEAAVKGLPAIASDTGGLRAYFDEDAVTYVPVGDVDALRDAIRILRDDDSRRLARAERAQARMGRSGLGARAFVERHIELSSFLADHDREMKVG